MERGPLRGLPATPTAHYLPGCARSAPPSELRLDFRHPGRGLLWQVAHPPNSDCLNRRAMGAGNNRAAPRSVGAAGGHRLSLKLDGDRSDDPEEWARQGTAEELT